MMVSRKPGSGPSRSPLRGKKKSAFGRYLVLLVVLVVVVVGVALVIGSSRKAPKPKAKAATGDELSPGQRRSSRRSSGTRTKQVAERTRSQKRRERAEARRAARQKRSRRSERGASVRRDYSAVNRLQMIVVDAQGRRLAVVGSRQYKTGDEVDGRRLSEVRSDEVLVEYRGKTYTVRVGQQLY